VIVFSLLFLAPGDPAAVLAGDQAGPEDIARIRASLGLDQPFLTQFTLWIGGVLQGDLGNSVFSGRPVLDLIVQRLEPTLALTVLALVLTVLIALPMGVFAAWRAGSAIDRVTMGFAVLGFSVPVFVLGYLLIAAFSVTAGAFPIQGYRPLGQGIGPFLHHLALPAIALALVNSALVARTTRAAMLEILGQDYIRTAHAKGLAPRQVLIGHALPNAAIPIVTILGISLASLIGGVVVTETVFNIPGIGRLTVDAILRRDYPVIQGVILLSSAVYVLINLLVDLSYGWFDPRIRA
jgi:peptide/nickel transport system permease protein